MVPAVAQRTLDDLSKPGAATYQNAIFVCRRVVLAATAALLFCRERCAPAGVHAGTVNAVQRIERVVRVVEGIGETNER